MYVGTTQQHALANAEILKHQLGVSLVVHKPVIPFVFGAQVEGLFSSDNCAAQEQKLKDFQTMFLALVTKYSRVLPGKLSDLSQAVAQAKAHPEDRALCAEVRSQSHKIKGTGGSLGFRQVGEIMAFIEAAAVEMPDKPPEEQLLSWAEIDRKLLDAQEAGEAEAREVSQVVQGADETAATPRAPSMARIMVVDDDTGFLDIVEELGRERLLEIVRATSYREALDKACMLPLDAALVNVIAEAPEGSFKLAGSFASCLDTRHCRLPLFPAAR